MMTIVKDTYAGTHDLEKGMCSASFYKKWGDKIFAIYGATWKKLGRKKVVAPKHGCWENLAKALKPYRVAKEDVPSPLNIFQTMVINGKTGSMRYAMTRPRPGGDSMDLRAEMDCLVGISACPEGGRGKDLRVVIYKECSRGNQRGGELPLFVKTIDKPARFQLLQEADVGKFRGLCLSRFLIP